MKKMYLFFLASMGMLFSCKKSDHPAGPPNPGQLSATISGELGKTDSLSTFNAYFKTATLADADVSGGITVFALANSAMGTSTTGAGATMPDASLLKDYIVKGVLKASDLTNGKSLISLSGKTLKVTVSGDTIRVNGVIIKSTPILTGTNYAVYLARQLFQSAAPVVITVWDATKWTASKTSGELAAQASVSLYLHPEDYVSQGTPAYTALTGNDGTVTFSSLAPGTNYYVVVTKGAISNVLSQYSLPYDGSYLGFGVTGITLDGSGNYVKLDANGDGQVNLSDIISQPYQTVSASNATPVSLAVSIGYAFKPMQTVEEVQAKLDGVYSGLKTFYEDLLLIDGAMSDDAGCESVATYCPYDAFTFTAVSAPLSQIWTNAYYTNISALNYILRDVPGLTIADDQKKDLIAQARGLRGYIYLELMTYFGSVPISPDLAGSSMHPATSRSSVDDVYAYVVADLTAAATDLPATRTDKKTLIKNAALGLLAQAALYKKDYTKVLTYCTQIATGGGNYSQGTNFGWLTSAANSETIWAPEFSNIGTSSAWYYTTAFPTVTVSLCPVLRGTHLLLMTAEAKIATGTDLSTASLILNAIRVRDGLGTTSFSNTPDGYTVLNETWKKDMNRQGGRFANLVRWQTAMSVLGGNGFQPDKVLLPVPQSLLQLYPNMNQNVGY